MTLQECYMALGGDYEDVSARLRSDRLVQKFILKFLEDGSFDLLCRSLEEKNYKEAFRAAHTIKGICQNLSFTVLLASSSSLTEALHFGRTLEAESLAAQVRQDYQKALEAILRFRKELG